MIYQFVPILKSTPWGGHRIRNMKGLPPSAAPIGESWELSTVEGWDSVVESGPCAGLTLSALIARKGEGLLGTRVWQRYGGWFPITIKFLDAREWLSLQVHPDDDIVVDLEGPGQQGKTEMWHVIDAAPGARLIAGFKPGITEADYLRAEGRAELLEMGTYHDARPGSDFYIEAGMVHALGAGCFVAEIAQNCDFTYRVYDYGRNRPLNFEKARRSLKFDGLAGLEGPVDCFRVDSRHAKGPVKIEPVDGSFQAVMLLRGRCEIDGTPASAGSTLLISADHGEALLTPTGEMAVDYLTVSI